MPTSVTPTRPAPGDPLVRLGRVAVGRTATRVFRTTPLAGTVLVAIVALVSLLTGGFDKVRDDQVPVAALNQALDAGFLSASVLGVRLLPESEDLVHTHPGDRWVAVVAEITVTADRSLHGTEALSAFRLRGVPGLRDDIGQGIAGKAVLARDGQVLIQLEPGVPERIGILWEQDQAAPLPTTAEVDVLAFTRTTSALTGERDYWRPGDAPAAKITGITVSDRRKG